MFVTNWISTTKIQKISEITNFFRHYFLSRTEVNYEKNEAYEQQSPRLYEEKVFRKLRRTPKRAVACCNY